MSSDIQTSRSTARTIVMLQNMRPTTWPVWISDGITFDKLDVTPISEPLKRRLLEWTEFYNDHQNSNQWDAPDSAVCYNAMGLDLANQVADELGPTYRVMVYLDDRDGRGWVEV